MFVPMTTEGAAFLGRLIVRYQLVEVAGRT